MKDKQAEREAFFDFYKQNKEPEEKKVYEGITLEPRPLPTEKDNPYNGANCLRCKWLDKSRTYKWQGTEFYWCKRKELIQKAEENKQGYKDKYGAVMASDLQTDGYLNGYAWKCENKDIDENLKPYLNELDFN